MPPNRDVPAGRMARQTPLPPCFRCFAGPCYRIVLHRGNDDMIAFPKQTANDKIETVCYTGRENRIFFTVKMEQSAKTAPCFIHFFPQIISGFIAAASHVTAYVGDKITHGLADAGSLGKRCTPIIQIYFSHHSSLSFADSMTETDRFSAFVCRPLKHGSFYLNYMPASFSCTIHNPYRLMSRIFLPYTMRQNFVRSPSDKKRQKIAAFDTGIQSFYVLKTPDS